jgi:isopenicillin N synthase-like dioxygenase
MDDTIIPIIDIAALRRRDPEGSRAIANQLGAACRDVGFFYITNHGVPEKVIADTFRSAQEFFSLPLEEKMRFSLERYSKCFRGYSPPLSELADGKRNAYELMEFSVEFEEEHPDVLANKPMHGPNQWPDLPGYREANTRYIEELAALGFDLMRGIAISLDVEEDYFYKAFHGRSFWQFRTAHYPDEREIRAISDQLPQRDKVESIEVGDHSCGAHTDYGCLTILLADSPGLQVLSRKGVWFEAPVIPNAYICNIGDMLQYWTKDLYVATKHRVMTSGSRISLPFFFQPDYESVIEPLAHIASQPGKTYPPLKYGPYAFENYKVIYPSAKSVEPLEEAAA